MKKAKTVGDNPGKREMKEDVNKKTWKIIKGGFQKKGMREKIVGDNPGDRETKEEVTKKKWEIIKSGFQR